MADRQPLISVIVPVYNAERYLDQCLNSIEEQSYRALEIICLNDGSTDGSLGIMRSHAERDTRIVVIDKGNQGYGATCNRGLEEARGDYLSIIEPDDWIEPSMYITMIAYASCFDRTIDIVKTPYWRIWMADTPRQQKLNCSYRNRIRPPSQPFTIKDAAHLLAHHPSIWSAIYRTSFLKERNIRFKEIPGAGWADNPFLIETLCQADTIAYLDEPFYCYREETPEKTRAFALNNTLLPLERWNDMMDVLDHLGITDEMILRAHYSRGFTYLSGIIEEVDVTRDDVRKAAGHMFSRMNAAIVLKDRELSPGCKRMFCELLDMPQPKASYAPYWASLFRQGLYTFKNNGIRSTLRTTAHYLAKHRVRRGRQGADKNR